MYMYLHANMNNAFYSNFAEGAKVLLEHGADINSKDGRQNTATMAAGALGHYDVLKALLDHRLLNLHAGVSECVYTMMSTALPMYMYTHRYLCVMYMHFLLKDAIGSTALHCAIIARRNAAVKFLLEAGADPSIPNYAATTPLHDAVRLGYLP